MPRDLGRRVFLGLRRRHEEKRRLTDPSLEQANLWIAAIDVEVSLPLELPEDCIGALDEFLEARATFDVAGGEPAPDIADAGTLGDFPARVDLEQ